MTVLNVMTHNILLLSFTILHGARCTKWIVIHCINSCIDFICWWPRMKTKQVLEWLLK